MKKELKPGKYKHYKGKFYWVHSIAKHSETLEPFVCYECLYENKEGKFWVRPLEMFTDEVEVNGKKVKRFEYIDNDWECEDCSCENCDCENCEDCKCEDCHCK